MARATRLRLLDERPAPGDDDQRHVTEAFPAPPPTPPAPNSQLGDDVLAVLRRDTDRALGNSSHAVATATAALDTAQRADQVATASAGVSQTLVPRVDQMETATRELGERTFAALAQQQTALNTAKATLAAAAQQIAALALHILAYLLDRAPALLALGAAVWLWQRVLDDPSVLRLIGLGLFGALVIAPALWLSIRRGGNAG